MIENKKRECVCPICSQRFHPADGLTAEEHLARGIIKVVKEMQEKEEQDGCTDGISQCMRCGEYRMLPKLARNALSRHADGVQICPVCGTNEAV